MNLTATAENGRARIELKGTIARWKDTEAAFTAKVEELIKSGINDVHIYINSPGGECFEANEIVNVIKKFPGKITGEGGALVASAATYVAINCSSFSMPENGLFMIHQVSGGACGKVSDIETTLEVMRRLNEHYLSAFLEKCTDKKKIKSAWDKGDYWMSAQEAKENGFVTEVTGKTKVSKTTAQMITNCGYVGEIEITDYNNNEKTENDMNLTMLLARYGMDASSTEAQFMAQVDIWKRKSDRVEMLEKQEEQRKEKEIDDLLNLAVKEKRITADVRDSWKENLTSNFDATKKMLDAIKPVEMPDVHVPTTTDTTNKKFEELQDDPQALANLMDKNPAEYERLLNDYVRRNGK